MGAKAQRNGEPRGADGSTDRSNGEHRIQPETRGERATQARSDDIRQAHRAPASTPCAVAVAPEGA
jgi:hypothetical protein